MLNNKPQDPNDRLGIKNNTLNTKEEFCFDAVALMGEI